MRSSLSDSRVGNWILVVELLVLASSSAFGADDSAIRVTGDGHTLQHRYVSKLGSNLAVVVTNSLLDGHCRFQDVTIEEKQRQSRLAEDVRTIVGKLTDLKTLERDGKCGPITKDYTLRYERATVTVTAVSVSGKNDQTVTIITGPKEHLYLGLDLPVSQRKTLKYDSATNTLQPRNDNPQLYLSVNYYFGDILSPDEAKAWWERFSLKGFVLPSKRPLDSFGVGAGYQLPKIELFDLDLSSTSIFVGRFWTREDAIAANGAPLPNAGRARDWRIGITYDVGAGLGWLKGK